MAGAGGSCAADFCGECGRTCNTSCESGECAAEVFYGSTEFDNGITLAVTDTGTYWADAAGVVRRGEGSNTPQLVGDEEDRVLALTGYDRSVLWINMASGALRSFHPDSNMLTTIATLAGGPRSLGVHGHVAWVSSDDGHIREVDLDSGGVTERAVVAPKIVSTVADSQTVFFANYRDAGEILAMDRASGAMSVFAVEPQPGALSLLGNYVYWVRVGLPSGIFRKLRAMNAPTELVMSVPNIAWGTLCDEDLYYSSPSTIFKQPSKGEPYALASDRHYSILACDSTWLWWLDFDGGALGRVPR